MSKGAYSPIPTLDVTSSVNQSSGSTLGTTHSKFDSLTSYTTTDLQQISLNTSEHPVEQADWIQVNEKLRNRGLNPIALTHPSKFKPVEGFVVLDEKNAEMMRKTIFHLLQENDRRQTLFEELANKSTQLKEDKELLEKKVKEKKELEPARSYRSMLEERYEQRIDTLQSEINDLRQSLDMLRDERHTQTTIQQKSPPIHFDPSSQKPFQHVLPEHIATFKKLTPECTPRSVTIEQRLQEETALSNMKLYKYKKKCAGLKLKVQELKNEKSQLQFHMNHMKNKTSPKDDGNKYEELYRQHKKLRKILEHNNLTYLLEGKTAQLSPKVHEVERLPIQECQKYLRDMWYALNVDNLQDAMMVLRAYEKKKKYYSEIEKLLEKLSDMFLGEAPSSMKVLDDRMRLLSTVDEWKSDRRKLKDIYSSIKDLSLLITPWKNADDFEVPEIEITTAKLKQILKKVTADFYKGPNVTTSQDNTDKFKDIVDHFMRLFDVRKYEAVYTRLHDVYVKHFELVNVFKSVREILHLNTDCTLNNMVDAIGQLAKARHLLHVGQLDSVIKRIEKYDEFYEAFHHMVKELLHILSVDNLDEIVPTVKVLLRFPQS